MNYFNSYNKLFSSLNSLDLKFIVTLIVSIILFIILIVISVSHRKKAKQNEDELRELDYLTKIYNRSYYYKKCKDFLEDKIERYAIIAFDVNKFKLINEYYGTVLADKLLMNISSSLLELYENKDILVFGRIESDKFSWIMKYDMAVIKKIEDKLNSISNNSTHSLSFNMGIYIIEDNNMPVEQAYSRANIAAKSIKGNFDKSVQLFDRNMIAKLNEELFIVNNIDKAMANGEILVYFQPKYDLQGDFISGAEALVRWKHPDRGMISPGEFIPALENNGLITKLDKFIWERTCVYIEQWLKNGVNPKPVSVNISKVDLLEVGLPEHFENLVRKYSIPHKLLELEITESAYTDGQVDVTSIIKQFKNKGFTILMDDFGSGYSSLNTLRLYPIDVLKIDLAFLQGFDDAKVAVKGKTILESIVTMAKHLNLEVVVEGTETIEQVDYCKSIGCEVAQGYYFSKPIPADDFIKMLSERRKKTGDTFKGRIDEEKLWSKSFITEDFFNSTNGALGVFLYRRESLEAIRLNDEYFNLIESNRKDFYARTKNILDDIYPPDLDLVIDKIGECLKKKSMVSFEYRRKNYNGNIKWIKIKLTFVNNKDSSVNYFFASMDDITEKKNAIWEKDNLLDNIGFPIIKCDLDSNKIVYYNSELLKYLNIAKEDFEFNYKNDYHRLIVEDEVSHLLDYIGDLENLGKYDITFKCDDDLYLSNVLLKRDNSTPNKDYIYMSILAK